MTTLYPGSLDTFTDKTDGIDYNLAADINNLQDSVEAVEGELGTNPAGSHATVKDRLTDHNHTSGDGAQIPTAGLVDLAVTTAKLAADAVDNTKLANMANATVKGRNTAGSGDPEDVTMAQLAALLGIVQNINNGTYTPIVTAVTNLDGVTAQSCYYLRTGVFVIVWGGCAVNPTATGATKLRLSLPIASDITIIRQLIGFCARIGVGDEQGIIQADITADEAEINYSAINLTNHNIGFLFLYVIV
jgi:hypothetical protein